MLTAALRAWRDVRRFNAFPAAERALVFYAEDAASWVHFEPILQALSPGRDRPICYVTSSHTDPELQHAPPELRTFCIGRGMARTWWFQTLCADVLIMTMPDLQTFQIKRSRVHPVHYVYVFHSMVSTHMIYRFGAFDHYDTVCCVGPHHVREIRAAEARYNLPAKRLVEHGYGRLDALLASAAQAPLPSDAPHALIAPSWGPSGLLETLGAAPARALLDAGWRVTVRPHPMTCRQSPGAIRQIEALCASRPGCLLERDIRSQESLLSADVMVSDWSGAAFEYAFALERPVIFVDTPRKINNPRYTDLEIEPVEAAARPALGGLIATDALADLPALAAELHQRAPVVRERIRVARTQTVFNIGASARAAADAINTLVSERRTG